MTVKGRVIPRPSVEIAVVDSSHRPEVGSARQKPRRVNRSCWDACVVSGVACPCPPPTSLFSDIAQPCHAAPTPIERVYGTLIEGAGADIARRLGAFEERSGDEAATAGNR